MDTFTPVSALLGGAMIGASAALLLLLNGRIAGISGILAGLLTPTNATEAGWRVAFIGGLVLAPLVYSGPAGSLPPVTVATSFPLLLLAGLLVGFGARLGAGCTSGHGVCGIGRGSPRSLVATGIFMAVATATVFATRHLVGA